MPSTRRRRVLASVLLAILPLMAATGAAASPPAAQASQARAAVSAVFLPAHAQLLGTTPKDGSTVETATEVVLSFNEDVNPDFVKVLVKGPAGDQGEGDPVVDGTDVTQALVADLPAGIHTVTYRVVSTDGHPVSGTIEFTTSASPSPTPSSTPSPSASPSTSATASSPAASANPSPVPSPSPTVDQSGSSGPSTGQWVAIAAGILVLLLIFLFMAARSDGSAAGGRSV